MGFFKHIWQKLFTDSKKMPLGAEGRKGEIQEVILKGHGKIRVIYRASEGIVNEKMRTKIEEICIEARKIYDNLAKHPQDIRRARRFLTYYMDTTVIIVNKYVELSIHKLENKEAEVLLTRAESVLDQILQAFKTQLSRLYEDDLLSLDVEITALEKSIKMDGLLDS